MQNYKRIGDVVETTSELYASEVKTAAKITARGPLTVSMVARAADAQGVDAASWFPLLTKV